MTSKDPSKAEMMGTIAVVTGAARGLGLAIAEKLACGGARVVIADKEGAESAARALCDAGLEVVPYCVDVSDSEQVDKFFASIGESYGHIDVLVNNAGIGQDVRTITELDDVQWNRVLSVNLSGTFYCCRAAARAMIPRRSGIIVNISSINGQNPAAHVLAYNVSKAGVIMLTRTLALELGGFGIRVNALCPGPVYTDFNKRVMGQRAATIGVPELEMVERVRTSIPLGRWGEPADIAEGVAFLCSPAASWITGEVLRISGGLEGVSSPPKPPPDIAKGQR